jgi:hypothetical protein
MVMMTISKSTNCRHSMSANKRLEIEKGNNRDTQKGEIVQSLIHVNVPTFVVIMMVGVMEMPSLIVCGHHPK